MGREKQSQRKEEGKKKRVRRVFTHPFQKTVDVGTRLLKGFEVGKKIANGAFGRVYKGKRVEDGRECAFKFVDLRKKDAYEGVVLEFELANLLSDVGVGPKVLGYWKIPTMDMAFLVTELWTTTLEDYLHDENLKKPSKKIMDLLRAQVEKMHKTGHVHLDIHSGNVLLKLDKKRRPIDLVLTDFGKSTHQKGCAQWQLDSPIEYFKLKRSNDPADIDWQMVEKIKKNEEW